MSEDTGILNVETQVEAPASVENVSEDASIDAASGEAPTVQESVSTLVQEAPSVNPFESLDDDYKALVEKKGFKSVEDSLKAYKELESLMGRKVDELTADELKSLSSRFGAPEDPSGYEFKLPEGIEDDGSLSNYQELMHDSGIPKEAAEKLFNKFMEDQSAAIKAQQDKIVEQNVGWKESLKKELGTAFEERVSLANQALQEYADPEFLQLIEEAGLVNHPGVIKTLAKIGAATSEDKFISNSDQKSFGTTPEEASAELQKLWSDPAFIERYRNSADPGHDAAVKKLVDLYAKGGKLPV